MTIFRLWKHTNHTITDRSCTRTSSSNWDDWNSVIYTFKKTHRIEYRWSAGIGTASKKEFACGNNGTVASSTSLLGLLGLYIITTGIINLLGTTTKSY
jgi:hypothetical protein